jgi:hypothetical protein
MAPTESFDPRTWKAGDPAPGATPVTAVKPAAAAPVPQTVSGAKFRWWLGPLLSAAILAGGAFVAYETRGDAPASAQ